MTSLRNTVLKGSIYVFVSVVIMRGLNLLRSGMTGRLLDTEAFGVLGIYDNLGQVIAPIITINLNLAATKYISEYMKRDREKVGEVFSTILIALLLFTCVGSVAYFVLSGYIGNEIYNTPILAQMIAISACFIVLSALASLFLGALAGLQKFGRISVLNLLNSFVSIPLIYFFILYYSDGGSPELGVIVASVATSVILFFASIAMGISEFRKFGIVLTLKVNKGILKKVLNYSTPITLSGIALPFSIFVVNSYVYLNLGAHESGLYRIGNFIYILLIFAPAAVSIPFMPVVSQLNASSDSERKIRVISKVLRMSALIAIPISTVAVIFPELIIYIIYGTDYLEAAHLTSILGITSFFASINTVMYSSVLLGTGRTWQNLIINIFQGITYIAAAFLLIEWYGLIGLGYAYLIQVLLYTSFLFVYLKRCGLMRLGPLKAPILLGTVLLPFGYLIFTTAPGSIILYLQLAYIAIVLALEYLILNKEDKFLIMDSIRSIIRRGGSGDGSGPSPPGRDLSGQL